MSFLCRIGWHLWEFRDVREHLADRPAGDAVWVVDTYARRCCHPDDAWLFVNRDIVAGPALEERGLLDRELELDREPLQ